MRLKGAAILLVPPLLVGSTSAQPALEPLDSQLTRARAEQAAAESEAARLERIAAQARTEADRLRAKQEAAAKEIEAAEARITAADAQLRLASAYVLAHRQRLMREQRPASSLLAGLAVMARRPPLLALTGSGSTDELVKVRLLLDSTLPVIRARAGKISAELAQGQRLQDSARAARVEVEQGRRELVTKRQQFAAIEQQALHRSLTASRQAVSTGDVALSAGEDIERLRSAQAQGRTARALASELASAPPALPSPFGSDGALSGPPFAYRLPVAAPVTEGLGEVDDSGVRSRGLTFATSRGASVLAPAAGVVRFAGPFRDYDGILLIDHGNGWMTLIVNLASPLKAGDRVGIGEPAGRALGPLLVELSQNGRRMSPAIIAGSSQSLSKGRKGG